MLLRPRILLGLPRALLCLATATWSRPPAGAHRPPARPEPLELPSGAALAAARLGFVFDVGADPWVGPAEQQRSALPRRPCGAGTDPPGAAVWVGGGGAIVWLGEGRAGSGLT